jgi:hypothetical protein
MLHVFAGAWAGIVAGTHYIIAGIGAFLGIG